MIKQPKSLANGVEELPMSPQLREFLADPNKNKPREGKRGAARESSLLPLKGDIEILWRAGYSALQIKEYLGSSHNLDVSRQTVWNFIKNHSITREGTPS